MKANVLLEEYIGLGRYKECGGWLGHFIRDRLEAYKMAFPIKADDDETDEEGNPKPKRRDEPRTPQEQEAALQEELRKDEERMKAQGNDSSNKEHSS